MRAQSQDRADVALSAARTRLAPTLLGLIAGVVAAVAMPHTTQGTGYFEVVLQVLPVLLLALAIEARAFGGRARHSPGDEGSSGPFFDAGTMEMGRQFLNAVTVLVLLGAEVHGLVQLSDGGGAHPIWPQNGALAWGFTTVAALALIGQGAPRVIATLETAPRGASSAVVEVGASNEYGDKDVSPLMNFLVPSGVSIQACDSNGNSNRERTIAMQVLQTKEQIAGVRDWNYPSSRWLVSAGDASVQHLLLGGLLAGRTYPLVLRFDHVDLPNGRVEVRLGLRLPVND